MLQLNPYADWQVAYAQDTTRRGSLPTKAPGRPEYEYADRYVTVPAVAHES